MHWYLPQKRRENTSDKADIECAPPEYPEPSLELNWKTVEPSNKRRQEKRPSHIPATQLGALTNLFQRNSNTQEALLHLKTKCPLYHGKVQQDV